MLYLTIIKKRIETIKRKYDLVERYMKHTQLFAVTRNRKIPSLVLNEDVWSGL